MTQFVASSAQEIGIGFCHLDDECDFVYDALTGAVAARKEFEIFQAVVGSNSVDVVHSFFGKKPASEVLFHNVPMFEYVSGGFGPNSGDYGANVAPTSFASADLLVGIVLSVRQPTENRSALGATQGFQPVDRTAWPALDRHSGSALDACSGPLFIGKASTNTSAPGRTVHRVFAPLFAVLAQGCRFVSERLFAHTAFEHGELSERCRATIGSFIRSFAGSTTETLVGMRRLDLKKGLALFTAFLDRHLVLSGFGVCSNDRGVARMFVSVNRRFEKCRSPA